MVQSKAQTVDEYLDELPEERRAVVAAVRKVIKKNLPKGYQEAMAFGMINYAIPLDRYPNTYNGQPLCYAALAAQKNHFAVYLMCAYGSKEQEQKLRDSFAKAGKKLDMGKSCVRFKKLEDLALDAIGAAVAAVPVDKWITIYEASSKR
jgi:hypothetical protein